MLKKIGTLARKDIELMLGTKVFLETWVKVKKIGGIRNWILPISDTTKKNIKKRWAEACFLFLERSSMPELPEVETVRRGLEKLILGKTIQSVEVKYPKMIQTDLDAFRKDLPGQKFGPWGAVGNTFCFI